MMFLRKLRGRIDFSGYFLHKPIADELSSVVEEILANEECGGIHAHLPGLWSSDDDGFGWTPPEDVLSIYIELPFSEDGPLSHRSVFHDFTIEELLDDEIGEDEWSETRALSVSRFSDALRALADKIDAKAAEWQATNSWPEDA